MKCASNIMTPILTAVALFLGSQATPLNALAETYTITSLGILPNSTDTYSEAYKINEYGQIIGSSAKKLVRHAFVWKEGTMYQLPSPDGYGSALPNAINNAGIVVGQVYDPSTSALKPVLWQDLIPQVNTQITSSFSAGEAVYSAINDAGTIIGRFTDKASADHAFVIDAHGSVDVGSLFPGGESDPASINSAGAALGYSYQLAPDQSIADQEVFIFQNGQLKLMPTSSGTLPQSTDLNSQGQIVGFIAVDTATDTFDVAFVLDKGKTTLLGDLGGGNSYANAINDRSEVVGTSDTLTSTHAFIWRKSTMTDLNSLLPANSGWDLREAMDINSCGQIVGSGMLNGAKRAFLMSPTGVTACRSVPSITPTPIQTTTATPNATPPPAGTPTPHNSPSPSPSSTPSTPGASTPTLTPTPGPTKEPTPNPTETGPDTQGDANYQVNFSLKVKRNGKELSAQANVRASSQVTSFSGCSFSLQGTKLKRREKSANAQFVDLGTISGEQGEFNLNLTKLAPLLKSSKRKKASYVSTALRATFSCPNQTTVFSRAESVQAIRGSHVGVDADAWLNQIKAKLSAH